jgi:glycine betaine/proline transport system substrate-binding protein
MNSKLIGVPALLAAGGLLLAFAGPFANQGGPGGGAGAQQAAAATSVAAWSGCVPGTDAAPVTDPGTGADKDTDLTIAAFNGWDESIATAHLLKGVLEQDGYSVTVTQYEAAPGFAGTAGGDIDLLTDVWMPRTHADYIAKFGDDLVHLGCWYDNGRNTIAVNQDSPARTIEDLKTMGSAYGNTLYGIEAGAGLTKLVRDEVIPGYGLQKLDFPVSSTPAMLAKVDSATRTGENVAVTLWRPHWAYSAYPMRDLEDPKGLMGDAETITSAGRPGFDQDDPRAAQVVRNMVLSDEQLADLEDLMMSPEKFGGADPDAAVAQWLAKNPDFTAGIHAGTLG